MAPPSTLPLGGALRASTPSEACRERHPLREGTAGLASSGEEKQAWSRAVDRLQAAISGRFDNTHKERVRAR